MKPARRPGLLAAAVLCVALAAPAFLAAQQPRREHKDIEYADVEGRPLLLDLYLPEGVANAPLLVWIHGGAWSRGSKDEVPLGFVDAGFAAASVGYRLSGEARFPAQIHDIKAAIRFLRAAAPHYGFQAERIAIGGSSAGAHLAALVGVTNGHAALEGELGSHRDQSSSVQAIVDYFGPTNLTTILTQSTPHGLSVRVPALELLLGGRPETAPELAQLASPVHHVDAADPPLLVFHGDQDPQVPINQSHELVGAYERHGLNAEFKVVHGAAHGGRVYYDAEHLEKAASFLRPILSGGAAE